MLNVDVKIAVLGLGKEGLDLLKFLSKSRIKLVGLDNKTARQLGKDYIIIKKLASNLCLGAKYLDCLTDFDIVFRSPGVPLNLPQIKRAKKCGVVFSSLIQLFFDLCPARIIGITGTKGKSTTASLIYHILKGQISGKVYLGGNIGRPPLSFLPKLTKKDLVVLELSSFQLEDLTKSPQLAVILDITPEHLDRHKTFTKYLMAKSNLFLHQKKGDYLITSTDHPITRSLVKKMRGKIVKYSVKKVLSRGVYNSNDQIIIRDIKTGKRSVVMDQSQILLLGRHNLENVIAAVTVAHLIGLSVADIKSRIRSFKPLEHRMELVGSLDKIKFINDSMATTPVATVAAVKSLTCPLSLILGGVSKGENLDDLSALLSFKQIKGLVLIGQTASRLAGWLQKKRARIPAVKAQNLPLAVKKASRFLPAGGAVVLTPAFASFDMFHSAYDRGNQFKDIIKKLIKKGRI